MEWKDLVDDIFFNLRIGTEIISHNENFCEIFLPFKSPSNDKISLCIKKENDSYVITDLGASFNYLFIFGVNIKNEKIQLLINQLKNVFNIQLVEEELLLTCHSSEELSDGFLSMVQAITEVMNHRILSKRISKRGNFVNKSLIVNLFKDEEVKYEENFVISTSVTEYVFDFRIGGNGLIDILGANSKRSASNKLKNYLGKVSNLKKELKDKLILILDDSVKKNIYQKHDLGFTTGLWDINWVDTIRKNGVEICFWTADKSKIDEFIKVHCK